MNRDKLNKIGRLTFAFPFLIFGIYRFFNLDFFIALVPDIMPAPIFWVALVGLALICASISIIIDKYSFLASVLLAFMILIFAFSIHLPNTIINWDNEGQRSISMAMMIKDIALAGGAFIYASRFFPILQENKSK